MCTALIPHDCFNFYNAEKAVPLLIESWSGSLFMMVAISYLFLCTDLQEACDISNILQHTEEA